MMWLILFMKVYLRKVNIANNQFFNPWSRQKGISDFSPFTLAFHLLRLLFTITMKISVLFFTDITKHRGRTLISNGHCQKNTM